MCPSVFSLHFLSLNLKRCLNSLTFKSAHVSVTKQSQHAIINISKLNCCHGRLRIRAVIHWREIPLKEKVKSSVVKATFGNKPVAVQHFRLVEESHRSGKCVLCDESYAFEFKLRSILSTETSLFKWTTTLLVLYRCKCKCFFMYFRFS